MVNHTTPGLYQNHMGWPVRRHTLLQERSCKVQLMPVCAPSWQSSCINPKSAHDIAGHESCVACLTFYNLVKVVEGEIPILLLELLGPSLATWALQGVRNTPVKARFVHILLGQRALVMPKRRTVRPVPIIGYGGICTCPKCSKNARASSQVTVVAHGWQSSAFISRRGHPGNHQKHCNPGACNIVLVSGCTLATCAMEAAQVSIEGCPADLQPDSACYCQLPATRELRGLVTQKQNMLDSNNVMSRSKPHTRR